MSVYFKAPAHFDAGHIQSMRSEFERLASSPEDVVVDMARTETLDGSGVGAMVFAFKRLSMRGLRLSVRNVSGQPLELLNESGLLRTLMAEPRPNRLFAAVRAIRRSGLPSFGGPAAGAMAGTATETAPAVANQSRAQSHKGAA